MNWDIPRKRAGRQVTAAVAGITLWGLVLDSWRAGERLGINVWLLGTVAYLSLLGLYALINASLVLAFGRDIFSTSADTPHQPGDRT